MENGEGKMVITLVIIVWKIITYINFILYCLHLVLLYMAHRLRTLKLQYLEDFEMCWWRRMEKIKWPERVTNEEVLSMVFRWVSKQNSETSTMFTMFVFSLCWHNFVYTEINCKIYYLILNIGLNLLKPWKGGGTQKGYSPRCWPNQDIRILDRIAAKVPVCYTHLRKKLHRAQFGYIDVDSNRRRYKERKKKNEENIRVYTRAEVLLPTQNLKTPEEPGQS